MGLKNLEIVHPEGTHSLLWGLKNLEILLLLIILSYLILSCLGIKAAWKHYSWPIKERYLDENNTLYKFIQSGLRSKYSTYICLFNKFINGFGNGILPGMKLISLQAFEIEHEILLNKLNSGSSKNYVSWYRPYLHYSIFADNIDKEYPVPAKQTCGVPQGSNLWPLIFPLYINDMS